MGLGAKGPKVQETSIAMAERPQPRWTSCHNPYPNNCQDLGNSILLLLGLIICINIGINMVTLVSVGPGGRVPVGGLRGPCLVATRAYLGSLCLLLPSSGTNSVASYTKCSILFVRKVSRDRA